MDINSLKEYIKLVINECTQSNYALQVASIIMPFVTSVVIICIQFFIDKKNKILAAKIEKANLTIQVQIDNLKTTLEQVNSYAFQNRMNCLEISKLVYSKLFELYWSVIDGNTEFENMHTSLKRYLYENAIYIDLDLQELFIEMLFIISYGKESSESDRLNILSTKFNITLKKLTNTFIEKFNLIGRIQCINSMAIQ